MITEFRGEHARWSNFHDKPVIYKNHTFRNRESAYQWSKFEHSLDALIAQERIKFFNATGREAKLLSKKLNAYKRPDWHKVNFGVMAEVIHAYCIQNKDERNALILTYPQQMTEGNNWHDTFWGVCNGQCLRPHAPIGENWLGRLLMAERAFWMDLTNNGNHYKDDRLVAAFEKWNITQQHESKPS
jgi:ribA/ribD-fused uncharacterized protein